MPLSKPIKVFRDLGKCRNCWGETEHYLDLSDHLEQLSHARDHKEPMWVTWGISWQSWPLQKYKTRYVLDNLGSPASNRGCLWTQQNHHKLQWVKRLPTTCKNYWDDLKMHRRNMNTRVIHGHKTTVRNTKRLTKHKRIPVIIRGILWATGKTQHHVDYPGQSGVTQHRWRISKIGIRYSALIRDMEPKKDCARISSSIFKHVSFTEKHRIYSGLLLHFEDHQSPLGVKSFS